jgi:hypothetical protein
MASGSQGPKQTHGYFVPLGNCVDKVYKYTDGAGAGGSFLPGSFASADWTAAGATGAGAVLSSISSVGQGGLLKDMGKTVVSSNRTFRKVQLMSPSRAGGVNGVNTTGGPYLTGYIELATGNQWLGSATPAPVAYLPGLL